MGAEIKQSLEWSAVYAEETRHLAHREAQHRQNLADQGFFDKSGRTCDIEHEAQAMNARDASPVDASSFMDSNSLGARPDTTKYNVEYDANGITPLTIEGIRHLHTSFTHRTRQVQEGLRQITPDAMLVPVGTQPRLEAGEWGSWVVDDPGKRIRYALMEERTKAENPVKHIQIANPATGEHIEDHASNLAAMARCSGTQFHISERTVEEALEVHNMAIAFAAPMLAMFGNSPFAAGKDTGRASSRIELLRQAEQVRAGLAKPANTLEQYYAQQLQAAIPPFIEMIDQEKALDLSMGAMHPTSRLQLDMEQGTIRNEFRIVDSQTPEDAIRAFVLTYGLTEGLRGQTLPTYDESQKNYNEAVWGLRAPMTWKGKQTDAQELGIALIDLARYSLQKKGMKDLAAEYLLPLRAQIVEGRTQADIIRARVKQFENQGASRFQALAEAYKEVNARALQ